MPHRLKPPPWHIGHVVAQLMEHEHIETQAQLAQVADIAQNTASSLLKGESVRADTLEKVARVFGMTRLELETLASTPPWESPAGLDGTETETSSTAAPPQRRATDTGLGENALFIARRFERLTARRQTIVMNVVLALENEQDVERPPD